MRVWALAAGLVASVTSASASGFFSSPTYGRLMDQSPTVNWTGAYAGLSLGYGWGRLEATRAFASTGMGTSSVPLNGFSTSRSSFNAGITAGYNFYASNVVFGIEADLSYGRHRYNSGMLGFANVFVPGDTLSGDFEAGFTMFSTLRGRLGYLLTPQAMLYATGGLAGANTSARVRYTYDDGSGPVTGSFRDSRIGLGWVAGVGIEDRFAENVSMKLEYLYVSLPRNRFRFSEPGMTVGFDGTSRLHILRTGLNFHF